MRKEVRNRRRNLIMRRSLAVLGSMVSQMMQRFILACCLLLIALKLWTSPAYPPPVDGGHAIYSTILSSISYPIKSICSSREHFRKLSEAIWQLWESSKKQSSRREEIPSWKIVPTYLETKTMHTDWWSMRTTVYFSCSAKCTSTSANSSMPFSSLDLLYTSVNFRRVWTKMTLSNHYFGWSL